ncbi:DUF1501 domain-containing protein (plasmid) [Pseudanabaena biceps]|nr:DUF1501 domain-containing protein [Pseudanabaena biceps]NUN67260.1 DUF1501 domain-containing protein [Pseudanabaena biceps]
MNRRDFLTLMSSTAAMAILAPSCTSAAQSSDRKTLVVIELAGGNDGLNTIVPYNDANYRRLRPTIAIKDGIPISNQAAFHPALKDLKPVFDKGRVAIVQNVSYPNPNLSHFRSKEIWQSAHPQGASDTGWLARYLNDVKAKPAEAIFLGEEYPLALTGDGDRYLQLSPRLAVQQRGKLGEAMRVVYNNPQSSELAEQVRLSVLESEAAVKQLTKDIDKRIDNHGYPKTAIGKQFALLARVLESQPKVVYLTIGGWDTHTGQVRRQQQLLGDLGAGLAALDRDIQAHNMQKNILVMVQSEFGRRPSENGNGGTDHGTAAPIILLGNVRGGLYGGTPALDSLVQGNLPMQVDFRSIYAEILNQWEGVKAATILDQDFPKIGIL